SASVTAPASALPGAQISAEKSSSSNESAQPSLLARAANSVAQLARAVDSLIAPAAYAKEEQRSGPRSRRSNIRLNHPSAAIGGQRSEVRSQKSDFRLNHASAPIMGQRSEVRNHANATTLAPIPLVPMFSGGNFPINGTGTGAGFTLPAGKTTTITFKATLNTPPALSGSVNPKVSAQGTLSGAFVGNPIVTDDPSVGGTTDPTVTNVDLYNSTTTVTSSSNPSNTSQPVTFTAAIAASGTPDGSATNRTGTVVFKDGGIAISGCTSVSVSSNQAQCLTSALTTGNHTITAEYSGDGSFDPSTGSLNTNPQVVNQSGTNATLTSSLNPAIVTQNITFTVTITSATSVTNPTGTVVFKDGGSPMTCTGGTQTLNGSGVATCQKNNLSIASHTITADYSGDTNFAANNGIALTANAGQNGNPQVVTQAGPTV